MHRRKCTACGREEPTYIYDPNCPKGGYCSFTLAEGVSHYFTDVRALGDGSLVLTCVCGARRVVTCLAKGGGR